MDNTVEEIFYELIEDHIAIGDLIATLRDGYGRPVEFRNTKQGRKKLKNLLQPKISVTIIDTTKHE